MGSPVLVSAQVLVYINGKLYAKVTGLSLSSATPHREIRGLDSSTPYELAPTTASVSGSVQFLRLLGDGGLEGDRVAVPFASLINEKYFSLLIVERRQNTVLFQAEQCCVTSQELGIPSRGIVTGSFNFTGIAWSNDSGL